MISYYYSIVALGLLYLISYRFSVIIYSLSVILLLIFVSHKNGLLLSRTIFHINNSLVILFVYSLFVIMGAALGYNYLESLHYYAYISLYFLPLLILISVLLSSTHYKTIESGLSLGTVFLSLVLYLAYVTGYLAENKYQHVGNILSASFIFIAYSNYKYKKILMILFLACILLVGSRQALVGLIFATFIYILSARTFLIICAILCGVGYFLMEYSLQLYEYFSRNEIISLSRIFYYLSHGDGRIDIFLGYANNVNIYPNYYDYLNPSNTANQYSTSPHNIFLEIAYVAGIIYSSIVSLLLLYSLANIYKWRKRSPLILLTFMYFVPANVSSGLTASKYFFFYLLISYILIHKAEFINENK